MTESPFQHARSASPCEVERLLPVRTRVPLAIEICCARPTLRRTGRIAVVVGVVLTGINEGDSLAHGHASAATGVKMALNFVVPFVVSNLGVLTGTRRG